MDEGIDIRIEHSLFSPKSTRSMFYDYPELKDNKDLVPLQSQKGKLKLAYYLGCETSPLKKYFIGNDMKNRLLAIEKAIKFSGIRLKPMVLEDYLVGKFPSDVKNAINAFNIYKPSVRTRLKLQLEKILENWEKTINVDIDSPTFNILDKEGRDTGEKDFDKIKKYTDISISIKKQMNDTLHDAEYGFGLTESKKGDAKSDDVSFTDLKHEGTL
tara:strand:- start:302 stop:943 length:642 start_codon:yes stop_codon:yes gene_type:complete